MDRRVRIWLNVIAACATLALVGGVAFLIAGMTAPGIVTLVGAGFAFVGWRMARSAMAKYHSPS